MVQKHQDPLRNWIALNKHLASVTDLGVLTELFESEKTGRARKQFLIRIHQRITVLERRSERAFVEAMSKPQPKGRPRKCLSKL